MNFDSIAAYLIEHGCSNITSDLDLQRCHSHPCARGGFSRVHQGVLKNGQLIAIKCLESLSTSEQANLREQGKTLKRAAREMYTWSCCKHQGVLPVLGFAQFMGYIALVTPWMEGGSLKQQISQRSMQSPLQTCIELAIAVEHLHEKGIVHGDIKPDNVLMTNQGQPQLADFGSALLTITRALNFTRTYTFPFTTRFAAPETLKEQGVPPTAESDVYSLGMTMFNIMSGSPPFADKWEPLVIVEVLSKGQPSRPDFDRSLLSSDAKVKMWDLLQSCFAYEPGDRLKVSQVKDALINIRGIENTHIGNVKTK